MDNQKTPKVTLKFQFNGRTVRAVPFTGGQMTAATVLTANVGESGEARAVQRMFVLLASVMGDDYEEMYQDILTGKVQIDAASTLLVQMTERSMEILKNVPGEPSDGVPAG